jgi:hypothetical protein
VLDACDDRGFCPAVAAACADAPPAGICSLGRMGPGALRFDDGHAPTIERPQKTLAVMGEVATFLIAVNFVVLSNVLTVH